MNHPRVLGAIAILGAFVSHASAQQIHRETFEGKETQMRLGITDGQVRLLEHGLVSDIAHSGNQAERFKVRLSSGRFAYIELLPPKALVFEELQISAWVYSDRPGTRLEARVVLPKEVDPETGKPLTTLLPGDAYEVTDRWRRLQIRRPDLLLRKQQQLLQAERGRNVDVSDAFVDQIVFNVHTGVGDVDVRIDDVNIGPIVLRPGLAEMRGDKSVPIVLRDEKGQVPKVHRPQVASDQDRKRVRILHDRLLVGDRPFFMRGIRRTDAPLSTLSDAGLNTVLMDWPINSELMNDAQKRGLQVLPVLPITSASRATLVSANQGQVALKSNDGLIDLEFDSREMAYLLGRGLDREEEPTVASVVRTIRSQDPIKGRPITADVSNAMRSYTRDLDMVGAHRYPLMTSLDLNAYRKWLLERKHLGRPGTLYWTEIQTHVPKEYAELIYGHDLSQPFQVPIGPAPGQIKAMTYHALAAGYRGLVFSSDKALSEAAQGRARMLQIALLNLELTLIEPFLAGGNPPIPAKTSHPEVGATSFRHQRGTLVVPYWRGGNSQYVLGQAALANLQVMVENAPEAAQVFQVSLAEIRSLKRRKDLGGIRVTVPEFDIASLVVLSTEQGLFQHYQELIHQVLPHAADWSKELAEIELAETERINVQLESSDQRLEKNIGTLHEARDRLEACRQAYERRDFRQTVSEARRCLRLTRLVRQVHWHMAIHGLDSPVADPYAVSFFTLPESRRFRAGLQQAQFGDNLLPSGDFETQGNLDALGWRYKATGDDRVDVQALLVGSAQEGKQALELRVVGKLDAERELPVAVAEHLRVELVSPPVSVRRGQVVRITGQVRLPAGVAGSVDGAMMWDSLGGESLARRVTHSPNWTSFTLLRPVNRDTDVRLHLAMTGLGAVQFDNLNIQVTDDATVPLAGALEPAGL
ncbi:hypothetical protein Pan216_22080 [Planctomycetes bacterium Pan216]|uniref:Uncharacterized protein n=1 Tax=Kolteria novifilia TaxID=2527975 RepID=A0A518B334_9BACT|nr:hypothetical protein Pan216_22080 [Planctomycetes bacterium Pan216]